MLSHRHATRQGDEIVIWSLLMKDATTYFNAEDLWRDMLDQSVNTGFLMSDTPRLNIPGFSWAPLTPYARDSDNKTAYGRKKILVYNGEGSRAATITKYGLWGVWLIHHLDIHQVDQCEERLKDVYRFFTVYPYVALLRPATVHYPVPYDGFHDEGGAKNKNLLATCVSEDGAHWIWKGVREVEANGLQFDLEQVLIV